MTFSFADPATGLYGLARLGLSGADGERTGSALAVLFAAGEPVAVLARAGVPVDAGAGFERLLLPGLEASVEEPLHRWTVCFDDPGPYGFDLTFEAAGPTAELDASEAAAAAGGLIGYEQLCHVYGKVRAGADVYELRCLGQRGHLWGEPDWDRIESTRTLAAWLDDGSGVSLTAVRPAGADHEGEATWAAVLGPSGNLRVDDPRLSTTYDDTGRQRRAGLELWIGEEDAYPRRAAGEVVCGSTLELGRLRLDCAFVRWRMGGRSGLGRYDLLRRA